MNRVLAVLLAVGLVAGAVLVRGWIDGPSTGSGGGGADEIRLVCGTDLADVCRQLADDDPDLRLTVEDEGTTADRLATAEDGAGAGFDAWLAAGPWAAMVADSRRIAGGDPAPLGRPSAPLARAGAAILAQPDRLAALRGACGGADPTWACIGTFAGRPWTDAGGSAAWGTLRPGLAAPEAGTGLVTLAQAVSSRLGRSDWAANDLDDPEVAAWFDQLVAEAKRANPTGADPAERFLVIPATYGAAGTLATVADPAGRRGLDAVYPEPVAAAEVTLVPARGEDAAGLADRLGRDRILTALRDAGWSTSGRGGAGLPSPGVLQSLRDRWEQVG